jgi:transcriptional regulator NrdR family protein
LRSEHIALRHRPQCRICKIRFEKLVKTQTVVPCVIRKLLGDLKAYHQEKPTENGVKGNGRVRVPNSFSNC